ncbi:MAG: AraC family transcriptional regulator [Chloroflexi bacterium]|nr:AraC family transcriptional regulator [Chloroflexota bacterium]
MSEKFLDFKLIPPSQHLAPYVRSYWYFYGNQPMTGYHEEYMNPTGGYGIAFNYGHKFLVDGKYLTEPIFLDGANTISRKVGFVGRVELLGIRFREGGAYPFLGIPLSELRNEIEFLMANDKSKLLELYARLGELRTLSERIKLIEIWLTERLALGQTHPEIIRASLAMQRDFRIALKVPDLASELGIGQRQLERLYHVHVGMTPKQYSQLLRLEAARYALKQLNGETTTSLALELGYYDQAHFIREFKEILQVTPFVYMKRQEKK